MTVKKGIQIRDYFLDQKAKQLDRMQELGNSFHKGEAFGLAQQLRKNLDFAKRNRDKPIEDLIKSLK